MSAAKRAKAQIMALRPLFETDEEAASFTSGLAAGILAAGASPAITRRFEADYSAFMGDDDGRTALATTILLALREAQEPR